MSIERGDSTIAKSIKGKVQGITYTPSEGLGNQWVTIDGTKYAVWMDLAEAGVYPGSIVEHRPYVEDSYRPHKLIATKIIGVVKKK